MLSKLFTRFLAAVAVSLTIASAVPQVQAADAFLTMKRIDVQTNLGIKDARVKTIFQSKLDPSQFYYLPSTIRFATGSDGEPMYTLIKYNFVYDAAGNTVDETSKTVTANSNLYQGGALKATFTYGLEDNELKIMQDALRLYLKDHWKGVVKAAADAAEQTAADNKADTRLVAIADELKREAAQAGSLHTSFKLGRLPLDSATFTIELTDPSITAAAGKGGASTTEKAGASGKHVIGPINAPLTDDIISQIIPLSPAARDIIAGVLSAQDTDPPADAAEAAKRQAFQKAMKSNEVKDFPINIFLNMTYSGFDVPCMYSVKGTYDKVFESSHTKAEVKGGWWFFSTSDSYEEFKSSTTTKAGIEIEVVGKLPDELEPVKDKDGNIVKNADGTDKTTTVTGKEAVRKRIMDEIFKACFGTPFTVSDPAKLGAGKGDASANVASDLLGETLGLSVGFGLQQKKETVGGEINYVEAGYRGITRDDVRFSRLEVPAASMKKHLIDIKESDWKTFKPTMDMSTDVAQFFGAHHCAMVWPGPNGNDTITWSGVPGGKFVAQKNIGNLEDRSRKQTYLWTCVFNSDLATLAKNGVKDLGYSNADGKPEADLTDAAANELKRKKCDLNAASITEIGRVYKELYNGPIVVAREYSPDTLPVVTYSQTLIPLNPVYANFTFDVNGSNLKETVKFSGDDANVKIRNIYINQTIKIKVPSPDVSQVSFDENGVKAVEKEVVLTVPAEPIYVVKKNGTTKVSLWLLTGTGVTNDVSYEVVAGEDGDSVEVQKPGVKLGATFDINLGKMFPALKK